MWLSMGYFVYRGTISDALIMDIYATLYTTNPNTYYRARIYDQTHSLVISTSTQNNTGTLMNPEMVLFGPVSNLPTGLSLFAIQLLATDATGNEGVMGRMNIGIWSLQLYG
jgi:hypothetical protein